MEQIVNPRAIYQEPSEEFPYSLNNCSELKMVAQRDFQGLGWGGVKVVACKSHPGASLPGPRLL